MEGTHNFVGGHYVDVAKGEALTEEQEAVYYEYSRALNNEKSAQLRADSDRLTHGEYCRSLTDINSIAVSENLSSEASFAVLGGGPDGNRTRKPDLSRIGSHHGQAHSKVLYHKLLSLGVHPENVVFGGIVAHNTAIFNSNVGIGTTSPIASLAVVGSGGLNPFAIASSTGTQLVTVTQAGNVGIGTAAPAHKLEVAGGDVNLTASNATLRIGTNGTTGQGFELQAGDSTNNRILAYNRTGAAYLNMNLDALSYSLKVSGTEKVTINSDGNVGIGTTTPGRTLTVVGDMRATGILYDSTNAAGSGGNFLMTTGTGYQWTATSTLLAAVQVWEAGLMDMLLGGLEQIPYQREFCWTTARLLE